MKRSASIAALPHIRMSESLPAAIEVHLRAFDAETVVDQDVHMVFGEDAAAVYLGEAEMARGAPYCMRIVDSLGAYSTGVVLLLDVDMYRDTAWHVQLELASKTKLKTVFVRDAQHAAAIAERMRLAGAASTGTRKPTAPPKPLRERREDALLIIPGVASKRAKVLLDKVGPISKVSEASVSQLAAVVGEASARSVNDFFNNRLQ